MLRIIFTTFFVLLLFSFGNAQTIFWSDNFDLPAGGANNNNAGAGWLLNSTGGGTNQWYIVTPVSQPCPAGGNRLQIRCPGILCTIFGGGATQPVYNATNISNRTALSPNISTVGRSNITLSFDYRSFGEFAADYGLVMLSNDGGATWVDLPNRYELVSNPCQVSNVPIPSAYENIANFRIGFRWINNGNNAGSDPPFTIDNITLSVPSCASPTANAGSNATICSGDNIQIGGSPTGSGTAGPYSYSWSPAAGLSNTSIANPTANPATTTTYTVTVTDIPSGCSSTSSVTITVNAVNLSPAFHD